MADKFKNKVAMITGAASGIGRATALAFAREGARVVVADIGVEGGEETVRLIRQAGGGATFVKTDVSNPADGEALSGHDTLLIGIRVCHKVKTSAGLLRRRRPSRHTVALMLRSTTPALRGNPRQLRIAPRRIGIVSSAST